MSFETISPLLDNNNNLIYNLLISKSFLNIKELEFIKNITTKNGTQLFLFKLPISKISSYFYDNDGFLKKNEKLDKLKNPVKQIEFLFSDSPFLSYMNHSSFDIICEKTTILDVFDGSNEVKEYNGRVKYEYYPIKNKLGQLSVSAAEFNNLITVISINYDVKIKYF
jgi:hypothetical protein